MQKNHSFCSSEKSGPSGVFKCQNKQQEAFTASQTTVLDLPTELLHCHCLPSPPLLHFPPCHPHLLPGWRLLDFPLFPFSAILLVTSDRLDPNWRKEEKESIVLKLFSLCDLSVKNNNKISSCCLHFLFNIIRKLILDDDATSPWATVTLSIKSLYKTVLIPKNAFI